MSDWQEFVCGRCGRHTTYDMELGQSCSTCHLCGGDLFTVRSQFVEDIIERIQTLRRGVCRICLTLGFLFGALLTYGIMRLYP